MRTCLIFSLALVACSDAPAQQVPPETDPARARFEQVAAALLAGDYHREGDWAGSAFDEIERYHEATGDPAAAEVLLRYASRYPHHASGAVAMLVRVRADTLGSLVEAPPAWWGQGEWYVLARNLIGECREPEGCWRDERVVEALLALALSDPDPGLRGEVLKALALLTTYEQAQALSAYPQRFPDDTTVGRPAFYGVAARYATPELTRPVRARLRQSGEPFLLAWLVERVQVLARHDLLPELRTLERAYESEPKAGGRRRGRIVEALAAAIPALEAAQAAGVVPGLPLDWPATPDDYEAPR